MERLRIVLEFSPKKAEEIKLYEILSIYSSPGAYIKDALRGLVPLPGKYKINIEEPKYIEDEEEDIMDV